MLSKSSLYALKAMKILSDGKRLGAQRLSEQTGAPTNYMGKVLGVLVRQKLLTARRGADGGVSLAGPPGAISLRQIVEPFERLDEWPQCILGTICCTDRSACESGHRWCEMGRKLQEFLQNTRLSDLSVPPDLFPGVEE